MKASAGVSSHASQSGFMRVQKFVRTGGGF